MCIRDRNDTVQVNMRINDSLARKLDYIRKNTSNRTDTARRILTTGIENTYYILKNNQGISPQPPQPIEEVEE